MRDSLIVRLESACKTLSDEGWHYHANSVALAIEEFEKMRWDIYYHHGFRMVSIWDERVYRPESRFFLVETIGM